ncbi:MAG: FAD-binding protein [Chloroflexi bacterium]|nr:FAD-binding protein [Chloroflexota bacterium]
MKDLDHLVDLLIVGSGAGGMVAALVGKSLSLDVLVIEKTGYFGGSTARSGGVCWLLGSSVRFFWILAEISSADSFLLPSWSRSFYINTRSDRLDNRF